jgi:hypothetical protein
MRTSTGGKGLLGTGLRGKGVPAAFMAAAGFAAGLAMMATPALAQPKPHFTYLWHLEQPVYWPERQQGGLDRYERAWETIQRKDAGGTRPADDLRGIFGLADRVNVYQWRARDSINAIRWAGKAGAQISYSGGLIENIMSLGNANQLGYSPGWMNSLREARGWTTVSGKPRADIVLFSFHHGLLPLLDDSAIRKELQLYKRIYGDAWGTSVPMSRGLFPSEMAFSERLIPILASEGVAWAVVSAEKISRAAVDFPVVYGSGGINTDPPNKADQLNPAQVNYYRQSISRGCSPAEAVPLSLTPQWAEYRDPATGAVSRIIVVPASQGLSWRDGYAPLGTGDFNAIDAISRPARPMLIMLAHDGDNAWGGGFSYYMEATPNLVSSAQGQGFTATTVEQYLTDFPVPNDAVVKVEQGAWVNADGDFGAPTFLNWNWPLLNSSGGVDIDNGWHVDARNWAVITAAQNRVDTAEQIWTSPPAQGGNGGSVNITNILYPGGTTNGVERGWHYFLGGLNSGFMYYGTALDMEVKPSVTSNRAMQYIDPIIASAPASADRTAPTIWAPQRFPWNPGTTNFGPQFGYRQVGSNGDFQVYTFAYDVAGITSVTLKYRLDNDGTRARSSADNDTYAGGPGVGPWISVPMTRRVFPAGNVYNDPSIDFYVMPQYIADQYTASVTGVRSALVDYYVEAVDARGNVRRSPIDHVWVGAGTGGGGGGGGSVVTVSPNPPVAGQNVTITYDPAGRNLAGASQVFIHQGINGWQNVVTPNPAMTLASGKWTYTLNVPANASELDMVFNNGAGTWDNNGGADWKFTVTGTQAPSWVMNGTRDTDSVLVSGNAQNSQRLWLGLKGDVLYVATEAASSGNDRFIALASSVKPLMSSMWGKAGQVAGWDAFLGNEVDSNWNGWFDAAAGATQQASGGAGGVLEGTINLRTEFGTLPQSIRVAVLSFPTANGTNVVNSLQVPPAITSNTTVEANEYIEVPLCQLTNTCCPADFDGSGFLDSDDFIMFVSAFGLGCTGPGQPDAACVKSADYDGTGFVDSDDFIAYVTAFEAGCN